MPKKSGKLEPVQLIVNPIDPKEAGSYKVRKELFAVFRAFQVLNQNRTEADWGKVIEAHEKLEALLLSRLRMSDGSPVQDTLDNLSAEQFDELAGKIAYGGEPVPPVSASS